MRRPFVAGNWKMNLDRRASVALARGVVEGCSGLQASSEAVRHVEVAVFPASVYLDAVSSALGGTQMGMGGQNMYHEANGAFTGEVSASMLLDLGCRYVILGHSERRHTLRETDLDVNLKVRAALAAGLTPIVCLGELLAEREAGQTLEVISKQCDGSLAGLSTDQAARLVVAYEPVWAIGTGRVATPDQAEEVHAALRRILAERYNGQTAEAVRILYGGSVKPDNAAQLLNQPNIDGALVGGASLKASDFLGIVSAAG